MRILPVLGAGALNLSPRVGHLHVTVDDLPWHWGDFSDNNGTIVVVGMPSSQHKVLIELADPEPPHLHRTDGDVHSAWPGEMSPEQKDRVKAIPTTERLSAAVPSARVTVSN